MNYKRSYFEIKEQKNTQKENRESVKHPTSTRRMCSRNCNQKLWEMTIVIRAMRDETQKYWDIVKNKTYLYQFYAKYELLRGKKSIHENGSFRWFYPGKERYFRLSKWRHQSKYLLSTYHLVKTTFFDLKRLPPPPPKKDQITKAEFR